MTRPTPALRRPARPCRRGLRRGRDRAGATSILVLAFAMIISICGLASVSVARLGFRAAVDAGDAARARLGARSAVELVIARLAADAEWRTAHASGIWTDREAVLDFTMRYRLEDEGDGDLGDDPTEPAWLSVDVSSGGSVREYRMRLDPPPPSDESALREFIGGMTQSDDVVDDNKWWAQAFTPQLPPDAIAWAVTGVEVRVERGPGSGTLDVRLHDVLPGGGPAPAVLEQVAIAAAALPVAYDWHEIVFSGSTWRAAGDGLCLALTTTETTPPARLKYESGGVSEPGSALIEGDPNWRSPQTDKALHYRIRGVYTAALDGTPPLRIGAGTWRRHVN